MKTPQNEMNFDWKHMHYTEPFGSDHRSIRCDRNQLFDDA